MLIKHDHQVRITQTLVNRDTHLAFLKKAQEDCNKFAERFRTYCSHTQRICRELTSLRSWDTYQEEKLLIGREAELLHMYCQLSDEVVRIRKHIEEMQNHEFEGCRGDINPSSRCWMGTDRDNDTKKTMNEFGVLDVSVPDRSISFLDNKTDILEVGKRAERAVYLVLRGPEDYPTASAPDTGLNLATEASLMWPFPPRTWDDVHVTSYFSEES